MKNKFLFGISSIVGTYTHFYLYSVYRKNDIKRIKTK